MFSVVKFMAVIYPKAAEVRNAEKQMKTLNDFLLPDLPTPIRTSKKYRAANALEAVLTSSKSMSIPPLIL